MPNVYARTLKRAADILGSNEQLAMRLNVPGSHLVLWLQGAATPPTSIFLAAVDLIASHDGPQPPSP